MDEIVRTFPIGDPTLKEAIKALKRNPNEVIVVRNQVVLMSPSLYERMKANVSTD